MNILFLAPQPFYEERGTPIATRWALETLAAAGHNIDLLTYPIGQDVQIKGVTLCRSSGRKNWRSIPIGFSGRKLLCDLTLGWRMMLMLRRKKYDVIHAVEESIFLALVARWFCRAKLVYDMDSMMSDQLAEKWPWLKGVLRFLNFFEARAVRRANLILPVCESLAERAKQLGAQCPVHILHDIAIECAEAGNVDDLRSKLGIRGPLALYVGNLEHYQGIDLLLEGLARVSQKKAPGDLQMVIVGGKQADVDAYRAKAESLGLGAIVHFLGPRPLGHLPLYLKQADILVSPRLKGINTPLKIYSYMLSGKAILATDIASHTQVLDHNCAMLVAPDSQSFGNGLQVLAGNSAMRKQLGAEAERRALARHTMAVYRKTLLAAYDCLGA